MKLQESERTEFKSIVVTDIKKEIIAFANCDGGKIYIGIEDDGTVIGVEDLDSVALQVSNMVRDAIKPDLTMFLHYETKEIEQKQVVIIDIQRGTERPYYIAKKGLRPEGVYVRQGYSSVPATDTAIRKMIKETDGDHFEDMRSLDQELTFCETKKEFQKRNITLEQPQMKTLGIINQDGIYTNLALLLSDQCVHTIKTAVFEGKNQNIFKDRKEFTGSVLKQVNEVFDYLDLFNKTKGRIVGLERIDTKDYPEYAIRESLLNAIIHRDYNYKGSILISLYDDHFEITSLGGIVKGLSLNDLYLGISESRNPNLANIFYRLKYVESFGTGIGRIIQSYDNYNKKPIFVDTDNAFNVTLYNVNYVENHEKTLPSNLTQEEKIVEYLKKNKKINRNIVEQLLDISSTRAKNILNKMCENKLIVMVGSGKNIIYVLK